MSDTRAREQLVAITGCGWVAPFAAGPWDEVVEFAAQNGGVTSETPFASIPDEFQERLHEMPAELKRDRGGWIAALGVEQAIASAGLELSALASEHVGFMLGSALTGLDGMIVFAEEVRKQSPRFVSPLHFPQTVGNYVAGAIARGYGVRGPNATFAGGVNAGLQAVVEAIGTLRADRARLIVAGGWDVLTEPLARGLTEVTPPKAEGACFVVLELLDSAKQRGGRPLAMLNAGNTADCHRRSCFGGGEGGDVRIDYWTGWSGASGGTTALLGGIAALHGYPIPVAVGGTNKGVRVESCKGLDSVSVQAFSDDADGPALKLRLDRP